jgi:hypothetical protein
MPIVCGSVSCLAKLWNEGVREHSQIRFRRDNSLFRMPVSSAGITAVLNQDRTAIDHNGLTGAESFLHQKQIG